MKTDHSQASTDGAHSHGAGTVPEASRAERGTSFELADFPVPNGREEEWRFTPVDRLQRLFGGELTGTAPELTPEHEDAVVVERVGRDDARLGKVGAPGDRIAAAAWSPSPSPLW